MFEKIHEIFKEIDKDKRKEHDAKIFVELEYSYTFREIIREYNDKKLYDDFSMKVWVFPKEDKGKFFAFVHRDTDSFDFDVSYIYPTDDRKDRNFTKEIQFDEISNLPAIDERVLNVEYFLYGSTNLEYTFYRNQQPELFFVESDVYSKNRLGTAGVLPGEEIAIIYAIDEKMSPERLSIEYIAKNRSFAIKGANGNLPFTCIFDKKWRYSVKGKEYEDIEKVFDEFWKLK